MTMTAIDPASAALAYARTAANAGGAGGAETHAAGGSFSDLLAGMVKNSVATAQAGEQQLAAGAMGQADLVNVVTAVAAAETTLEAVVAVRDKVIAAYQEIMRMPV